MKKEYLFHTLLIVLFFVIQYSFVRILPTPFNGLNVILISLVFVLVLEGREKAFLWAVGFGFLSGSFSFFRLNIDLLLLPLFVVYNDFLLVNFFTNRSLYSYLIMTTSSIFFYNILFFAIYNGFYGEVEQGVVKMIFGYFDDGFKPILINIFFSVIIFYLFNFVGKKFKPAFLDTTMK